MQPRNDKKSPNIFFRFHWNDYSNKTSDLSHAQHGAYLQCMLSYYKIGQALPPSFTAICRMTNTHGAEEEQNIQFVLDRFFENQSDGSWRHERIEEELCEIEKRRQKALDASEKRWHSGRTSELAPSSDPSDDASSSNSKSNAPSIARNDANNNNNNNKDEHSKNDDQAVVAVVSSLESKHMEDIGPWGQKHRLQMEAWIQQYGQAFMHEAITVAKARGFDEGVRSRIAIMVTTHLPEVIAELVAERARAAQQKKDDEFQAASIERQTQEIIAQRDNRPPVAECTLAEFFPEEELEVKK